MRTAGPILKDLVLVGGGHSHVAVLRSFGMSPLPGVRVTLICRDTHTPYSGMLPGLVAGLYDFDEAHIDLRPLARFAGARFYRDEAAGLDLTGNRVLCRDRPPVPFDVLSINIGSTPGTADTPGAAEAAMPVKPIGGFLEHWERLCDRVLSERRRLRIGTVGAGAGGIEILLAAQARLGALLTQVGRPADAPEFHLFGEEILPTHNRGARGYFRRLLAARGVAVHLGSAVVDARPDGVTTRDGRQHALDAILWASSAAPAPWLAKSGLALDERSFIAVDDRLQSISHPAVFAAGDIASIVGAPRAKSGVFAVRQGPPLARNLRHALRGEALARYRPQRRFLSIIGTGGRHAVAARGFWWLAGDSVWRWKEWIDRRFMRRYNELPDMQSTAGHAQAPAAETESEMRCGGCGAKVGGEVLARALARLKPLGHRDVLIGLEAPDDAAVVAVPEGLATVQSVDFFRAFIDDPYVFGAIAANHCLGDVYAMGAKPHAALAVATLPWGREDKLEEELYLLIAGALRVLDPSGAALVGGHTAEGAELGLGFSVTGLADPRRLLRKAGLRAGDRLILTKPLGTGTLLAAEMRGKAKGRWIDNALATMMQSNAAAAAALMAQGATACTDVTGFGLLGHLLEMTRPSGVAAALDLATLPLLEGALDTLARGILSTLEPQNRRRGAAIRNAEAHAGDPRFALLFDPQTAGGLLAGVPAARAEACLAELNRVGCTQAAIIGTVRALDDPARPIALSR